jgi:hypothetical protein
MDSLAVRGAAWLCVLPLTRQSIILMLRGLAGDGDTLVAMLTQEFYINKQLRLCSTYELSEVGSTASTFAVLFYTICCPEILNFGTNPSKRYNPLNAELNPICHLLALLGGTTIVVVSRLRVKDRQTDGWTDMPKLRFAFRCQRFATATKIQTWHRRHNPHPFQSLIEAPHHSIIMCCRVRFSEVTLR